MHTHITLPKEHLKVFVWFFFPPTHKPPPCWSHSLCGILQRSVKMVLIIALKRQTSSLMFEITIWKKNFQEPEGLTGLETEVLVFKGQVYPNISLGQLPQARVIILYSSVQVARRRFGTKSGQMPKGNREEKVWKSNGRPEC